MALSITLNGDIESRTPAQKDFDLIYYFVDLAPTKLRYASPRGGPLNGGTLLVRLCRKIY